MITTSFHNHAIAAAARTPSLGPPCHANLCRITFISTHQVYASMSWSWCHPQVSVLVDPQRFQAWMLLCRALGTVSNSSTACAFVACLRVLLYRLHTSAWCRHCQGWRRTVSSLAAPSPFQAASELDMLVFLARIPHACGKSVTDATPMQATTRRRMRRCLACWRTAGGS